MFKATITRVSEYTLYVDAPAEDMEFVEWCALERAKRYPEEWVDSDIMVDMEEVDPETIDKNISFGVVPRKTDPEGNLDTGGYGKQEL